MFFVALEKQELKEPQKWWTGSSASTQDFQEFTESITDSTRHTKQEIPTLQNLSLVFGWQSKQLDCYSTTFNPDNSPHPPPESSVWSYSTAFSMWGALDTSKRPMWELQWGDMQPQPSWAGPHLSSKHKLETGCESLLCEWVSEWVSEWVCEL